MPPQTLLLTGAPTSNSLEWDSANLLEDFTAPLARFARLSSSANVEIKSSPGSAEPRHASWRSLDLDRQHLPTGHSQVYLWTEDYQGITDFFSTSNLSFAASSSNPDTPQLLGDPDSGLESREVLSQFYEHSFAVHTTTVSSQITASQTEVDFPCPGSDAETSFDSNETSFTSKTDSVSVNSPLKASTARPVIPVRGRIVDLREIPNAQYLDSIQPQTMTTNIIVGIISVESPRAIRTRRGAEVEIVELLVGDGTKSGFGVNFWLSAGSNDSNSEQSTDNIRKDLVTLRPQDIVLLRNVALASFRGKVYGQSLRRETTKIHLLYRSRVDRTDVGGYYTINDFHNGEAIHSQIQKTMHVRDWVLRFVAPRPFYGTGKEKTRVITESLPLDTQ